MGSGLASGILAALLARHFTRQKLVPLMVFAILLQTALIFWSATLLPGGVIFWASIFLSAVLLCLALIDARIYRLPDILTLHLCLAGLALTYFQPSLNFTDHLIGAIGGFAFLWSFAAVFKKLRGIEALGFGDVKLAAAAGAWLSWQALPGFIFMASVMGILFFVARAILTRKYDPKAPLPFGVPMALALWLVWLYGPGFPLGNF